MPEIIKIVDPNAFAVSDYETLTAQLPRFSMRGLELMAYINKMITRGELYALVVNKSLCGLIGFYANDTVNWQAYLSLIVIDSSQRGGGYGSRLLNKLLVSCRQSGMKTVSLNVVTNNTRAVGFYEHMGFVVTGKGRDDFHLLMTKQINENDISTDLRSLTKRGLAEDAPKMV